MHGLLECHENVLDCPKNRVLFNIILCIKLSFLDSCFYAMTDLGDVTLQTLSSIESTFHCQYKCLQSANCQFFSFNVTSKSCDLKTSGLLNVSKFDIVSGPKICSFTSCKCLIEFLI